MAFEDLPGAELFVGEEVVAKTSEGFAHDVNVLMAIPGVADKATGFAATVITRNSMRMIGRHYQADLPCEFEQNALLAVEGGEGLGPLRALLDRARAAQQSVTTQADVNVSNALHNFDLMVNGHLGESGYGEPLSHMLAASLGTAAMYTATLPEEKFKRAEVADVTHYLSATAGSVFTGIRLLDSALAEASSQKEPFMVVHFPQQGMVEAVAFDAEATGHVRDCPQLFQDGKSLVHEASGSATTGRSVIMTASNVLGRNKPTIEVGEQDHNKLDIPYTSLVAPVWAIRRAAQVTTGGPFRGPFRGLDGTNFHATPNTVIVFGLDDEVKASGSADMFPRRQMVVRMAALAKQELGLV